MIHRESVARRPIGSSTLRNPSAAEKSELWSAVALQQHLTQGLQAGRQRPTVAMPRSAQKAIETAKRRDQKDKTRPLAGTSSIPSGVADQQCLTLGQRLGLVERPPEPLSRDEWATALEAARARGDDECCICREEFGLGEQVLLSCSHTLHSLCLLSFEKHSGVKICPVCRKEQYQKIAIDDGKRACLNKCATRIQALWRMHAAQSRYDRHLEAKGVVPKDAKRRQRFYARKLGGMTNALVEQQRHQDDELEAFFSQIDNNVALSKEVFSHPALAEAGAPPPEENDANTLTREEWAMVRRKAVLRGDEKCAICVTAFGSSTKRRHIALLSCSHVLHAACCAAFEEYNKSSKNHCPICRAEYTRTLM